MDPKADVKYDDQHLDLLRKPTDPSKKHSLEDVFAEQRNRFEHLKNNLQQMTWPNQVKS